MEKASWKVEILAEGTSPDGTYDIVVRCKKCHLVWTVNIEDKDLSIDYSQWNCIFGCK